MIGRSLSIAAMLVGFSAGALGQAQTQLPATTSTRTTVGEQADEKTRAAEEALKPKPADEAARKKLEEKGAKPKSN